MTDDLLARHRAVMPSWMPIYYGDDAFEIVSGSGRRVTDANGRSYLDFFGGVLTNMLGYDIAELASEVAADRTAISFMQRSPCGARQTGEPLNKVLPSEKTRQYVEKLIALQDRLMEIERIVSAP